MPLASDVSRLPHLPPPGLTAYLDTNPVNPRNQSTPRGYLIWLKSAGQELGRELHPDAGKQLRRELRKAATFLENMAAQSRSMVLFTGPDVWKAIPLQAPVHDEIHWGKPSLQQMAWVRNEHRQRGAVLIDESGARFFRFWLGAVTEDEEVSFSIDTSDWRKPHLVGPATTGVSKRFGVQRDRVASRMQAQWSRFATSLADKILRWSAADQINPIVLVGDKKMIKLVEASMPKRSREEVVLLPKILDQTSPSNVLRQLEPVLREWERKYEEQEVERLISASDRTRVLGIDETLHQLQRGRGRELVIARGFRGTARQCINCAWVTRAADPGCPLCGSMVRSRTLRTVMPELASAFGVPMEIVAGRAADKLKQVGGIGAWLGPRKTPVRKLLVTPAASRRKRRK